VAVRVCVCVQVEDTLGICDDEGREVSVQIVTAAKPGTAVREIGSDIAQGEVVLQQGECGTFAVTPTLSLSLALPLTLSLYLYISLSLTLTLTLTHSHSHSRSR
jgi:hypothetical protein